jgi:hypothetical protein
MLIQQVAAAIQAEKELRIQRALRNHALLAERHPPTSEMSLPSASQARGGRRGIPREAQPQPVADCQPVAVP